MSLTFTIRRPASPRERRQLHGRHGAREAPRQPPVRRSTLLALTVGALGVVFGDIGTSPLYALQIVCSLDGGVVRPTAASVYGVVSLGAFGAALFVLRPAARAHDRDGVADPAVTMTMEPR